MTHKAYNYGNGGGDRLRPVTINCSESTLRSLERYQKHKGEQAGRSVSRSLGLSMLVKEAERSGLIQ